MSNQCYLRHVLSRNLDSTRFAVAIFHVLRAADLADPRCAKRWFYLQLKPVPFAFTFATLGESGRKNRFAACRTSGRIPKGLCYPFGGGRRESTPRFRCLTQPFSQWRPDAAIPVSVLPKVCFAEKLRLHPVKHERINCPSEDFLKVIREARVVRYVAMQQANLRVQNQPQ
jgi:hypothetical protein